MAHAANRQVMSGADARAGTMMRSVPAREDRPAVGDV
ncbi:hypothetical protein ABIC63_004368 [Pseudacidovorax sp. 1753]